jgi:hypothetical protein
MKKETVEEASERIFPHHKGLTITASNKIMLRRAAFIKGAKWKEENQVLRQCKECDRNISCEKDFCNNECKTLYYR